MLFAMAFIVTWRGGVGVLWALGAVSLVFGLPIDELITPLTEEQVEATVYDLLVALGLDPTSWPRRGTSRVIIRIVAKLIAGFTVLMAAAIRGTILELSTGSWLTVLARYVYGVQ